MGVSARSCNPWFRIVTDQRRLNLPLFALGAVAAHAVVLAAFLPMLVTLPGPGAHRRGLMAIDVEVVHDTPAADIAASDPDEITAALPASPPIPEPVAPADRVTIEATAPLADAGPVNDMSPGETGLGAAQPGGESAIARAEPPTMVPPPDEPVSPAATEPAKPTSAVAPKQVERPVKKPVMAAKPAPRAQHVAKAKPKAAAPNRDFNALFSGTILAPTPFKPTVAAPQQRATR